MSVPQIPAAATAILTSSGTGVGSGQSLNARWPGPLLSLTMAFIFLDPLHSCYRSQTDMTVRQPATTLSLETITARSTGANRTSQFVRSQFGSRGQCHVQRCIISLDSNQALGLTCYARALCDAH